ncbi:67_t:CDS:2 [Racocetra fulgida]|uniref:67_t:CDS:1 n=1 Tax=Racocetra fulgida TaxID=60492 RepID=A0A9N9ATP6_9GLOM|nr:67_t:CDS:2 [Racocetra fulgida]
MNNTANTANTADIADTNTNTDIRKFFTPQNYLSQTTDSSNNQNKKLVKDNYPYIHITRIENSS